MREAEHSSSITKMLGTFYWFAPDVNGMIGTMKEEKLEFGFVSSPVKVGDTVHRQAGLWTATIHNLLNFLNNNGFKYAPKPMGLDEKGREILEYLPGEAAVRPWPQHLLEDDGLCQAARMLREYHDIVRKFVPPDSAEWRIGNVPYKLGQVIRHGDLGPWNTLWQEGKITGLIDWDFAEPGEAIADLAQMAYYFVPLRGEKGWQEAGFKNRPDFQHRLKLLCEAYGDFSEDDVLCALESWLKEELRRVREFGAQNKEPWRSFLRRGDDKEILQDLEWLKMQTGLGDSSIDVNL